MVDKREFIVLSLLIGGIAFILGRTTADLPYATTFVAGSPGTTPAVVPAPEPTTATDVPQRQSQTPQGPTGPTVVGVRPAPGMPPAQPTAARPAPPSASEDPIRMSPGVGPAEPLAHVIECTDFQCPVCARAAQEMEPIIAAYRDRVRFEVKMNPLSMHARAKPAALAALAAHRQGKFWPYAQRLFSGQRALQDEDLLNYAQAVGLDEDRFRKDLADPALEKQVVAESALCNTLGARGTPGFFFDGLLQQGWGSAPAVSQLLDQHLQFARHLLDQGIARSRLPEELVKRYSEDPPRFLATMYKADRVGAPLP